MVAIAAGLTFPTLATAHMTGAAFTAGKAKLVDHEKAAKDRCAAAAASGQRLCEVNASSDGTVARAELRYRRSTSPRNGINVLIAKAQATHAVEREKCAGAADRVVCISAAKQALQRALKLANDRWVGGQAEIDAAADARRFDFEDAMEKCTAEAGASVASCRKSLGWQFGQ